MTFISSRHGRWKGNHVTPPPVLESLLAPSVGALRIRPRIKRHPPASARSRLCRSSHAPAWHRLATAHLYRRRKWFWQELVDTGWKRRQERNVTFFEMLRWTHIDVLVLWHGNTRHLAICTGGNPAEETQHAECYFESKLVTPRRVMWRRSIRATPKKQQKT